MPAVRLTTEASRKGASTWLTRDTLRPHGRTASLGLSCLFSASSGTIVKATGFPSKQQRRDCHKYLFVRYIEKSENLKILTSTLSRASESRPI